MKSTFNSVAAAVGMILLGAAFTGTASAGCGDVPGDASQSIRQNQPFRFVQAAYRPGVFITVDYGGESIVGLWQFTFTAKGNGTAGPPDGTPIDADMFHGTATEPSSQIPDATLRPAVSAWASGKG